MSRRTLLVSGILLVFLVNLNMQREGAGPNLNRELLLRLRRAAPIWAVLATAEAATRPSETKT